MSKYNLQGILGFWGTLIASIAIGRYHEQRGQYAVEASYGLLAFYIVTGYLVCLHLFKRNDMENYPFLQGACIWVFLVMFMTALGLVVGLYGFVFHGQGPHYWRYWWKEIWPFYK